MDSKLLESKDAPPIKPPSISSIENNSFEFPVIDNVKTNSFIDKIGKNFKEDNTISLSIYGERQTEAFKLMKKAGWN